MKNHLMLAAIATLLIGFSDRPLPLDEGEILVLGRAVFAVDRVDGEARPLANPATPVRLGDVAVGPDGWVYAIDEVLDAIFAVHRETGWILPSESIRPFRLEVGGDGHPVVVEFQSSGDPNLVRVDRDTGEVSLLAEDIMLDVAVEGDGPPPGGQPGLT